MKPPWRGAGLETQETIRLVLDEPTVDVLRLEADARGLEVEVLIARLLVAASSHVDQLLRRA